MGKKFDIHSRFWKFGGDGAFNPAAGTYTVTVPPAFVASDLTAFPLKIDLRDMPPSFWTGVDDGGGNIRAYAADGVTLIPLDVVNCKVGQKTGTIYAKADLSSTLSTSIVIKIEALGVAALAVVNENGRNAVWTGCLGVVAGDQTINRTGGLPVTTSGNIAVDDWMEADRSPDLDPLHQGIACDGFFYYGIDSGRIVKWDSSWVQVAINSDPIGSTGLSANHLGDGAIIGGELWVPIETWPSGPYVNQHLAIFNVSDLTFNRSIDISAAGREASGVCERLDTGHIYVTDYEDGTGIPYFNSTGVLQGTLTLSAPLAGIQGITEFEGKFYVNASSKTYEIEHDGTVNGVVYSHFYSSTLEGIAVKDGNLLVLSDYGSGATSNVRTLERNATAAMRFHAGLAKMGPMPSDATWCMSAVFSTTNDTLQSAIMSLARAGAESSYAALYSQTTPDKFSGYDNWDGWMTGGTDVPAVNFAWNHVALQYTSTAGRDCWVDGVNVISIPTSRDRPGGTDMSWYIGAEDSTPTQNTYGHIEIAVLRSSVQSDAWLAFEGQNHKSPSSTVVIV